MFSRIIVLLLASFSVSASQIVPVTETINGFQVNYLKVPDARLFHTKMTVNYGRFSQDCEKATAAHVLEHILADRNELADKWQSRDRDLFYQASTNNFNTTFETVFFVNELKEVTEDLLDVLFEQEITEERLNSVLPDVMNERIFRKSGYSVNLQTQAIATLEDNVSYCEELGSESNLTHGYLMQVYDNFYTSSNMQFSISGPLDWETVKESIRPQLNKVTKTIEPKLTVFEKGSLERRFWIKGRNENVVIIPTEGLTREERRVLGYSIERKLYNKYRVQEQRIYAVDIDFVEFGNKGYISLRFDVNIIPQEQLSEILKLDDSDIISGLKRYHMAVNATPMTSSEAINRISNSSSLDINMFSKYLEIEPFELQGVYMENLDGAAWASESVVLTLEELGILLIVVLLLLGLACDLIFKGRKIK